MAVQKRKRSDGSKLASVDKSFNNNNYVFFANDTVGRFQLSVHVHVDERNTPIAQ